jgi:protein O-mannosyl-transferase
MKVNPPADLSGTAARSIYYSEHFIGIALISIAGFLAYSNSLHGIWALDDVLINQSVGLGRISELTGSRMLSYLSFTINQRINPYDQFNFRFFNLCIHILNSILVYVIAFITLTPDDNNERDKTFRFSVALISAGLFVLHPLNINAVAYIIQRMASLAAFFVLLSLIAYIFAAGCRHVVKKVALYCVAAICILFSILSKENGLLAIPLILLYDYIFVARFDRKAFARRAGFFLALGFFVMVVSSFYVPVLQSALNISRVILDINKPMEWKGWMATDIYWSPLEHILTEFRVVGRYMFLFLFPLPQFLVFDWWGYPVSKGIFTPLTTFFSMIFLGSIFIFSILRMKKYPFLSFGILWYLIAISLESFIAIGSDLYFEHRNYLPLTGLCFGTVAQIFSSFRTWTQGRYIVWVGFVAVLLIFGGMTFQRNFIWNNPIVFWKDIAQKVPENPRASFVLANCYFSHSNFNKAEEYYKETIRVAGERKSAAYLSDSLYRLGFMYLMLDRITESKKVIDAIEKVFHQIWQYNVLQGLYLYVNHDYDGAIGSYLKALDHPFLPEDPQKRFKLIDKATILALTGDAYRAAGVIDRARDSYEEVLALSPLFPAAHHGLAKLDMMQRRFDSASEHIGTALLFDPYNVMVLSDMAYLALLKGDGAGKALSFAQRAVVLNPPLYQPYLIMGTVQIALGKDKEAEKAFIKAQELRAHDYQILFNMAWAYSLRGDRERQKHCLRELTALKDVPDNIRNTASRILLQLTGR